METITCAMCDRDLSKGNAFTQYKGKQYCKKCLIQFMVFFSGMEWVKSEMARKRVIEEVDLVGYM